MTTENLMKKVSDAKNSLMNSTFSFFGGPRFRDFFDANERIAIDDDVRGIVMQYNNLDLWNRIVWYLTTPISQYMVLSEILALQEMENTAPPKTIALYDYYQLEQHVGFLDWLLESIRHELNLEIRKMRKNSETDVVTTLEMMDRDITGLRKSLVEREARMTSLEGNIYSMGLK